MTYYLNLFTENLFVILFMTMMLVPVVIFSLVLLFELYKKTSPETETKHSDQVKRAKGFDDFLFEMSKPATMLFAKIGKGILWLLLIVLCISLVVIITTGIFAAYPLLGLILLLIILVIFLVSILKP